ncbi:MAG: hypothetical protein N2111_13190, partial [Candidatus Sumerlaeaceae bacterium]|nr:hypothetical protein [Candidatus Sumerlaeaceae bacterium]
EFIENLDDFRRDLADGQTRSDMQEHLAQCDVCRAALDEAQALRNLLRQTAEISPAPEGQYFDTMRKRVLDRIAAESASTRIVPAAAAPGRPRWRRVSWWMEVAAIFAFGVLAASLYHQSGSQTPLGAPGRTTTSERDGQPIAMARHTE